MTSNPLGMSPHEPTRKHSQGAHGRPRPSCRTRANTAECGSREFLEGAWLAIHTSTHAQPLGKPPRHAITAARGACQTAVAPGRALLALEGRRPSGRSDRGIQHRSSGLAKSAHKGSWATPSPGQARETARGPCRAAVPPRRAGVATAGGAQAEAPGRASCALRRSQLWQSARAATSRGVVHIWALRHLHLLLGHCLRSRGIM
mmetsp:Transcript_48296/g.154858  ORF Transcript_48296/g.154858 Transcript_48296/m.154858 type:complete len:203 (+) Transcript_48296:263-871(+)